VFPTGGDQQYHQDLDRARVARERGYLTAASRCGSPTPRERPRSVWRCCGAFADVIDPGDRAIRGTSSGAGKADLATRGRLRGPLLADVRGRGLDNLWTLFHCGGPALQPQLLEQLRYDALVDEAGTLIATDPDQSQALYVQAMNLLVEEAPALFLFDAKQPFVVPDYIAGFEYNPNYPFSLFFYEMTLAA
jgi:ABC-type transport system substrate-binding protein